MHQCGYVHGDILLKNMIFDGVRIRLIDHELSLKHESQLRATYPWICLNDLSVGKITFNTDMLCLKATALRLFNYQAYVEFRKLHQLKLKEIQEKLFQLPTLNLRV
jgi:tRNA A-37 threonylcarbamoyl transferase component Bud32